MYNLKSAEALVQKIISGEYKPALYDDTDDPNNVYDPTLTQSFIEEALSKENLRNVKLNHGDVKYARDVNKNQNRFRFEKDMPELTDLLDSLGKTDNNTYRCSGLFHAPNNGFCGWHTNSTAPGDRMYLVWAEEDNKSFFRWEDPFTGEIITKWEKKGWNINKFVAPVWHCLGSWTTRISIGIAHMIDKDLDALNGSHSCKREGYYGDWSISEADYDEFIDLRFIRPLLNKDRLKTIDHKDICWKGEDFKDDVRNSAKYSNCKISYPGILVKGAKNPKNRKYRMIDGKHRITKMYDKDIHKSLFYVFDFEEIKKYIRPLDFVSDIELIR